MIKYQSRLKSSSSSVITYIWFFLHKTTFVLHCWIVNSSRIAVLRQLCSWTSVPAKRNVWVIGYLYFLGWFCPWKNLSAFVKITHLATQSSPLLQLWKLIVKIRFVWVFIVEVVSCWVNWLKYLRLDYFMLWPEIISIKFSNTTVQFQMNSSCILIFGLKSL